MRIQFAYGNPDLFGNLSRAGDTLSYVNNWLYHAIDSWSRQGGWERVGLVQSVPILGQYMQTMDKMKALKDTGYSPKEAAYPHIASPDLFGWMTSPFGSRRGGKKRRRQRRRR